MGLLNLLAAKRAKAQVEDIVRVIHISTFLYLENKYKAEHDSDTAAGFAVAVANALFGAAPANQVGKDFLSANVSQVDSKLREIASDTKICTMVSVCVYIKTNAAGGEAMVTHPIFQRALKAGLTPEMLKWLVKMRDFGILRPAEQIQWPSSMEEFDKQAMEFEQWVLRQTASPAK